MDTKPSTRTVDPRAATAVALGVTELAVERLMESGLPLDQIGRAVREKAKADCQAWRQRKRRMTTARGRRQCDQMVALHEANHRRADGPVGQMITRSGEAGGPRARERRDRGRSYSRTGDSGDGEPGEPEPLGLAGPSPRFSRPWRPDVERLLAERLSAPEAGQGALFAVEGRWAA